MNPATGTGEAPLSVEFTSTATGADTIDWDFGDGTTGTGASVTHMFNDPKEYIVAQTVTNADGSTSKTAKITVTKPITPVKAGFETAITDLSVKFTDKSTGVPTKWSWDFGDGSISNLQNPENTYASAGTYTVKLSVENVDGSKDSTSAAVTVKAALPALVADFTADKTTGQAPLEVQFTDKSTGGVTHWLWTFQDGTTSTQQNPKHTFAVPAGYHVVLTVSDDNGRSAPKDDHHRDRSA